MFEENTTLYIYAETPLHPGSGTGLGVVDLPIQRERSTGYPMIQASSIKGKLRSEAELKYADKDKITIVFGPSTEASEHAGAIAFGDARILLFPVRSLMGVFSWVTSKDLLARFVRDAKITDWQAIGPDSEENALVPPENDITVDKKVVLEEFDFSAITDNEVKKIADWLAKYALPEGNEYQYWREKLPKSLVILPENAFRDFVQFSTEIVTRIRLDYERKTVQSGALWTEEYLPSDTLLYTPVYASKSRKDGKMSAKDVLEFVKNLNVPIIQLGGDETIGRGIVRLRWGKEVNHDQS